MKILNWLLLSLSGFSADSINSDKVVVGYYESWGETEPEDLSYSKVTHINYRIRALSKPYDPAAIIIDRHYGENRIKRLKALAKQNRVKVLLSLGEPRDSQTFSTVTSNPILRKEFINNILVFLRDNVISDNDKKTNEWNLDGLDLDWKYPTRKSITCDTYTATDSLNFFRLVRELREALDSEFPNEYKLLTAAVRVEPFNVPGSKPKGDITAHVKYFDFINIMAYDNYGYWSSTDDANLPFKFNTIGNHQFSFFRGISDWIRLGFPANKIVYGIPFYGRLHTFKPNLYNNKLSSLGTIMLKDTSSHDEYTTSCNELTPFSSAYSYKTMRQEILRTPTRAKGGYLRRFDPVTLTPWLFNPVTMSFVSYEDPQSIQIKVNYVKRIGLRGVMFWEMGQDYQDELLNTLMRIRWPATTIDPVMDRTQLTLPSVPPHKVKSGNRHKITTPYPTYQNPL